MFSVLDAACNRSKFLARLRSLIRIVRCVLLRKRWAYWMLFAVGHRVSSSPEDICNRTEFR